MTATEPDAALKQALTERAMALGFARVGVARAQALEQEGAQLDAWLAAGYHGEMDYMRTTADVRRDPNHAGMLPSARSIVVLAAPYARAESPAEGHGRIARYARGRDYHNVLYKRLRKLAAFLREQGAVVRAAVDSMPVFERAWAERAGLGFIGKNCCLIVPGLGSHVFLSALVTSAQLPADSPMARRCGACEACLVACPTEAFVSPRKLDARACIAYLTIEKRGAIDPALRPRMGDWLFGCDACQDVCPFNRTRPPSDAQTQPFAPRAWGDAEAFLEMDEETFLRLAEGSPLKRTGRAGMARNAALVLANGRVRRALPLLQRVARDDPDAAVRDAATWAVQRLRDE